MSPTGPWSENWDIVESLGKGGQGTTFIAKHKSDGQRGVVKILKHQDSTEARRRMYREVGNLKALHGAGCKVPQILDGNTEQFESANIPLFFVMEVIAGQRLCDVVGTSGLPLEKSIALMSDLIETIKKALGEDVIHRDLKPENIIVRNLDSNDVVVVDYGLSFNINQDGDLTRTSETLDNSFFSLPERRVVGGNRRDPRSELTSVCAILYYCITAKAPVDLVGHDGRAPHRRAGVSVKEKLGNSPSTTNLEVFFDRGFAPNIEDRFQSIPEIFSRLNSVLNPAAKQTNESPNTIAARVGKLLLQNDRATQIREYTVVANNLTNMLAVQYRQLGTLTPFQIEMLSSQTFFLADSETKIPDTESKIASSGFRVSIGGIKVFISIIYEIAVKGSQCGVFRLVLRHYPIRKHLNVPYTMTVLRNWEPLIWYNGLIAPDWAVVQNDAKAMIVEAMGIFEEEIRSRPST